MPKHDRPKRGRGQGTEYRRQQTEVRDEPDAKATRRSEAQAIREGLDDVLDDIDEVLEENAQEFIDGFVQKGGE